MAANESLFRREMLVTAPNPAPRTDYAVTLSGLVAGEARVEAAVRYVPDRLILPPDSFASYMGGLAAADAPLEALGLAVLDDLLNELVPRWIEVTVRRAGDTSQEVLLTDRQPGWENQALMERLAAK